MTGKRQLFWTGDEEIAARLVARIRRWDTEHVLGDLKLGAAANGLATLSAIFKTEGDYLDAIAYSEGFLDGFEACDERDEEEDDDDEDENEDEDEDEDEDD